MLRPAQQSIDSSNQTQVQSQTQNHPQASAQETNPGSSSSSEVSSTNANALDPSAVTAQQNAAAVIQFQKLQDSFAPGTTPETQSAASSGNTSTPQGKLLDVST
jgi:hypothetical protein